MPSHSGVGAEPAHSGPTPPARGRLPIWLADAITKCLSGAAVGLFIAFVIMPAVRAWFPALQEWSVDRGMRLGELVQSVQPRGKEIGAIDGYVFIDVDPGGDGASERACGAVAQLVPRPQLRSDEQRDCAPWRPVNRYLLSDLVRVLRAREAKLIVLDVELSAGGYPLPARETSTLLETLRADGPPAIAILPAQPLADEISGQEPAINVRPAALGLTLDQALAIAAPALPYSGDRIRRYVDCYAVQGDEPRSIPSITARAEELLHLANDRQDRCTNPPERILFTLPSLPAEVGPSSSAHDSALWSRYHLFYDRCVAADLAKIDSPCAQASLFKGKVIVIGASSRARGDRHLTPFGEMAGAEVVLNAIRSRLVSTHAPENTLMRHFGHEFLICAEAAMMWLVGFILIGYVQHRNHSRARIFWLQALIFASTICLVLWVSVRGSFSIQDNPGNLDLMIPVLAFGLQTYTDAARYVERMIERPIRGALLAFGMTDSHGHE